MLRTLPTGLMMLLLAACGTATVVWRTQGSGVIELRGDRGKAMDEANNEMAGHCGPNNYPIVAEGQEPGGTDYQQNTAMSPGGTSSGYGRQRQRPAMVWRVHYQCNGMAGPQPMPAAAPQDPSQDPYQDPSQQQPPPPPPPPPPASY
jgi:hypothetical protein